MGRSFESVRMGVKDVSARWLKASRALKKEDLATAKTHMSLRIRTEAHARKMKVISADSTFIGNRHEARPHTRRMKNLMNS